MLAQLNILANDIEADIALNLWMIHERPEIFPQPQPTSRTVEFSLRNQSTLSSAWTSSRAVGASGNIAEPELRR